MPRVSLIPARSSVRSWQQCGRCVRACVRLRGTNIFIGRNCECFRCRRCR
jgi:hypothetical protein